MNSATQSSCAKDLERDLLLAKDALVHYPCDKYGFSVAVVFRSKAQCEGNGNPLVKHCNAAAGHHRDALRVSLSTPTDCVAPLDKGVARAGPMSAANVLGLDCEARLAENVDKLTELAIITLKEHLLRSAPPVAT